MSFGLEVQPEPGVLSGDDSLRLTVHSPPYAIWSGPSSPFGNLYCASVSNAIGSRLAKFSILA